VKKLVVGHGYLGRLVAARWLAGGHHVYATTRSSERAGEMGREGITPLLCDVTNPATLGGLPDVDAVVYCIGYDRGSGISMGDVYVHGLENVLRALPTPGKLVYVGSSGVYGQSTGEEVTEHAPTEPADESGRLVLEAEQTLRRMLPEAVVLRFAGIYGPGRLLRSRSVSEGEPIAGDPDRWLNLIHVEDGAAAVSAAEAMARPGEIYNVCDDEPVRRRDFYRLLANLLGAQEPRFVPPPADPPPPGHERTHRRIVNRRLRTELELTLRYPSYREGLPAAAAADAR